MYLRENENVSQSKQLKIKLSNSRIFEIVEYVL